jgi:hypothetical protein
MNPPAPVTRIRGFAFTGTPVCAAELKERLFYRGYGIGGKLRAWFETEKPSKECLIRGAIAFTVVIWCSALTSHSLLFSVPLT